MKKVVCVLVAILIMMVTVPSYATTGNFPNTVSHNGTTCCVVKGGSSQRKVTAKQREEQNSMDVTITYLDLAGQSNFRFRGYEGNTNTTCTYARQITGTGYNGATYTSTPDTASMKMSIASTNPNDKVYFKGSWAI